MSHKTDDTTGLSQLFHLNSEPWPNEQAHPNTPFIQKTKTYRDAPRVSLPDTEPGQVEGLATARRSARAFRDEPLALADLAALLRAGYAMITPEHDKASQTFLRRPVPSAGGLYPLELYLLVRNVEGLRKGLYHYDAVGDALETLAEADWEETADKAFLTWRFAEQAPVVVCIGAAFERTQSKYGPRGYRYVLLEAGHVAQNLCLSAGESGLASLCLGGFHDGILNRLFALDGRNEAIIYTVALGTSADTSS